MNRINQKDLDYLVNELNILTNSPLTYSDKTSKTFKANIGYYCTDLAYGGIKLARITNESGGQRDISKNGYGTKRELYDFLTVYIAGIELNKLN